MESSERRHRRTLSMPWRPTAHTAAADAKYKERRPHITLTPVSCHLSPDDSHSLSGSHFIDRHAARTWMVRSALVMAPKRVMRVEAVLSYRWRMARRRRGGEKRDQVRQAILKSKKWERLTKLLRVVPWR